MPILQRQQQMERQVHHRPDPRLCPACQDALIAWRDFTAPVCWLMDNRPGGRTLRYLALEQIIWHQRHIIDCCLAHHRNEPQRAGPVPAARPAPRETRSASRSCEADYRPAPRSDRHVAVPP